MTITNQNVPIYRGNTAQLAITITMANGAPFDPTFAKQIKWQLQRNWHSTTVLTQKQINSGIALVTGGVTIDLEAADTDLVPGLYYHELKVWDVGDVATAMTGTVIIKRAARMGDMPASSAGVIALSASVPTVA